MAFGLFGSASKTSNQTTTTTNQVGASEGSVSAGQGATVNVQNLGGEVTTAALSAVVEQGRQAAKTTGDVALNAITAIRGNAADVLSTTERTTRDALGFGTDSTREVFSFAREILEQAEGARKGATEFASRSQELVAAGAGITPPAQVGETIGQFVRLIAIVAAAGVGVFFLVKRKA